MSVSDPAVKVLPVLSGLLCSQGFTSCIFIGYFEVHFDVRLNKVVSDVIRVYCFQH